MLLTPFWVFALFAYLLPGWAARSDGHRGQLLSGILIAVPVPLHAVRLAGGVIGLGAGIWMVAAVRTQLHSTLAP